MPDIILEDPVHPALILVVQFIQHPALKRRIERYHVMEQFVHDDLTGRKFRINSNTNRFPLLESAHGDYRMLTPVIR